MIIEIKDLPIGQKIKSIQFNIEFNDVLENSGVSTVVQLNKTNETNSVKEMDSLKDIPDEMKLGEF